MSNILEMAVSGKYVSWLIRPGTYKIVTYGRYSQRVNRFLAKYYPINSISLDSEPVFVVTEDQLKQILIKVFRDKRF